VTAAAARPRPAGAGRGWLADLARSAAGPVICAIAVTGLLSAWAAMGGAGTLTRVRLEIVMAAVPMRAFTPQAAASAGAARTYLAIRNLDGTPDELIAVRSPIARHVILVRRSSPASPAVTVHALTIPASGILTLSPLTDDVVLEDPVPFENNARIPLTLVFRHAGQITIEAPVTGPGTP
jgi:periplasmic copper chaperone A